MFTAILDDSKNYKSKYIVSGAAMESYSFSYFNSAQKKLLTNVVLVSKLFYYVVSHFKVLKTTAKVY